MIGRLPLKVSLTLLALTLVWPAVGQGQGQGADDSLGRIRRAGRLVYGADEEGGAPYFYRSNDGQRRVGFEADLMTLLGRELGVEPEFRQVQWEYLLPVLGRGEVDLVVNGYELTESRVRDYRATRPYYVYQLALMARRDGPVRSLADFELPRPGGGLWQVGVLGMSAADTYLQRLGGANVRIRVFDGATVAMTAVRNGQIDATLQDGPAARFYVAQADYRDALRIVGPPVGCGYYVLYVAQQAAALQTALDQALGRVIASGALRTLYERYGVWNDAQASLSDGVAPTRARPTGARSSRFDLALLGRFGPRLLDAALTTIILAVTSMPLAMALGLAIAIGRVYGPKGLALPLSWYVELVRGTPLLIQLYALFYLLPEWGITLSPWAAGVGGLAINYSAYEAEIYRAGLQAIPPGQTDAALALGMTRAQAIRRVVVPQAVRLVIPPVTSDFIALFKDTSVCSVITLTELTKQYSILFNSQGGVVEFGVATAALYMAMSLPLARLSRWAERRMQPGVRPSVLTEGRPRGKGEPS